MLKIYNTLTRQKELFTPRDPKNVGMYVCGMTVYDLCHIGHARVLICFDMINRFLRQQGWPLTYVRNITDIDDKIIRRAEENNEDWQALTVRFIQAMNDDAEALNILSPDEEPKATEHIDLIINMIQSLIDKGAAYLGENGDVYFEVRKFANYGKLSNQTLDKLHQGVRIEVAQAKRDALDFVLWKASKPGEPSWDAPWGSGRPGWHIECSAMSTECLGNEFDIHGGGPDLMFPHHENEIAQSEAATGCDFAKYWMHVGALQINKEKMSKSLGNYFTIRDILAEYPAEVLRYFMLASHYRSPLNYEKAALDRAYSALARLYNAMRGLTLKDKVELSSTYATRFLDKMNDDFNTPEAFAVLFDMVSEINRLKTDDVAQASVLASELKQLASVLGLLQQSAQVFLCGDLSAETVSKVDALIVQRTQARSNKDWPAADSLRAQLQALKVIVEDGPDGTVWRVARN